MMKICQTVTGYRREGLLIQDQQIKGEWRNGCLSAVLAEERLDR
jgi:RimJ/RimL family protein N-acetyltransferase